MVGLVLVSHSRPLAHALVNLVKQVSQDEIKIAYSAGAGENRQDFGTDAVEIAEAIQSVYTPAGVLVLMDLGSAILSAELALEFLPPETAENVRFCAAPLVEGAIAAAVQASLGSDLDTVCMEARQALIPKAEQLGQGEADHFTVQPQALAAEEPGKAIVLTLTNEHGLHARPAARFVQLAGSFDAQIQVRNLTSNRGPISAKSLNALATLGAVRDHEIEISASGPQADQALAALRGLVESRFGEQAVDEAPPAPTPPMAVEIEAGGLRAVPVSEGIALGPVWHYKPPPPRVPGHSIEDPDQEWEGFQRALALTQAAIQTQRSLVRSNLGETHAAIFDAHLLILQDPDLIELTRARVYQDRHNAALAWKQSIDHIAARYRALENPYLQQRAIDVEDVGSQLLHNLAGTTALQSIQIDQPVILVAQDLTPTQTAQLDMEKILGLVTVGGGPTSHSAILARALGIPAVAGVDASISALPANSSLGLDGFRGVLWVDPAPDRRAELKAARSAWLAGREALLKTTHELAVTKDGERLEVAANVGNPLDAETAVKNGAEAIGLLRTEFLFLTRLTPPDEDEQVETLRKIGQVMGTRPVLVRTLDVGGDKELPYLEMPAEANPFLGVRALRLSLKEQTLFKIQLRAILRAGEGHNFRVMFPMVTSLAEIFQANDMLDQAHRALDEAGVPHQWPIETGTMIETPAAALLSPILARHVDFFSIGTNDLTQYTLAAERGNPNLSQFADALNPAVLKLIRQVVTAAHDSGKWVGVCGELAGDPVAVPVLVGLGVDELSLNPGGIPKVKAIVRKLERSAVTTLAEEALGAADTATVRQIAGAFLESLGELA